MIELGIDDAADRGLVVDSFGIVGTYPKNFWGEGKDVSRNNVLRRKGQVFRGDNLILDPFNPATEIRFELPQPTPVVLDTFDSRGRLVRRLVDETLPAGLHRPVWRGLDQRGQRVASGVYYARVTTVGFTATTSVTLVK